MNTYINNKAKETLQEVKGVKKNNLLWETRPYTFNNGKMVCINEVNAKTLISRHSENGFIAVSPCRGYADFNIDPNSPNAAQQLAEINNKRIKECISLIKNSGYTYTPVYGGFIENQGSEDEQSVYERSFVIYNEKRNVKDLPFEELYNFGLELAKKYNQDSILVKAPGEQPKYITQDGNVDMVFDNDKISFNDVSQTYFTDLHKNTDKFNGDMNNRKPTRFSYTESYINPGPQCYSESHSRYASNEVFLPYKF